MKALRGIASWIDLAGLLQQRFGLMAPGKLRIPQALEFFDEFKGDEDTAAHGHGDANNTVTTNGDGR